MISNEFSSYKFAVPGSSDYYAANKSTIWSLKENNKRLVTIELTKIYNQNKLNQVRGFTNRSSNELERVILNQWFEKEKIFSMYSY